MHAFMEVGEVQGNEADLGWCYVYSCVYKHSQPRDLIYKSQKRAINGTQ